MSKGADARALKARHPLCPYCGHDLVTTVARRARRCPECGEDFDPADLRYERRAGDWSMLEALRLAGRALIMRSGIALVVVIALTCLMFALMKVGWPRVVFLGVTLVELAAVGSIFSRRLFESVGFDSMIVIVASCAAAFVTVSAGQAVTAMIMPGVSTAGMAVHASMVIFGACTWIVYALVTEQM